MTTTATTTATLTRADIRALRTADRISFHDRAGQSDPHIVASRRTELDRDPFAPLERTHTVFVSHTRVQAYDGSAGPYDCYAWYPSAQHSPEWQSIARSLREGEQLSYRWIRGNDSPVLTDAHLVRDELHLSVGREGRPARHYLIAVEVGRDNSARMIRG